MKFDISGLSKTIWLLICLFIGLWSATDTLHDKKAERRLAGRIFLSIAIVLVWVLIGLVTVGLAKVIAEFVGIFLIILLFYYFFNCRLKMTKETKKQIKHAYDLKVGQSYILSDGFDHDLVKLVQEDRIDYSPELITTYADKVYYFDGIKMSVPEFDNLYQLFNYCKKQGYKIYET